MQLYSLYFIIVLVLEASGRYLRIILRFDVGLGIDKNLHGIVMDTMNEMRIGTVIWASILYLWSVMQGDADNRATSDKHKTSTHLLQTQQIVSFSLFHAEQSLPSHI